MSKKTHKLRGVTLKCTKHRFDYPMSKQRIEEALDLYGASWTPLPDHFDSMTEHHKLLELSIAGIKHIPRYT